MKRALAVVAALMLPACARVETGPSFLGMMTPADTALADDASTLPGDKSAVRPELRHITSNKVLGAMAFQKTTGRTVDPARLQGSR